MKLININRIEAELKDYSFGQKIYYFKSIDSTNEFGKKLLETGKHQPAVIIAEKQTKGKGRMGRKWSSPSGKGIWMSILFTFVEPKKNPFVINYISSLAVQLFLKNELNIESAIKWPNDILIDNKKVCGILLETVTLDKNLSHIVAGIGLNVNQKQSDFSKTTRKRALSLKMALKEELDRTDLIISILRNINNLFLQEKSLGTNHLFTLWMNHCSTIGQEVEFDLKDEKLKGIAQSISIDGALSIKTPDNKIKKIITGDVNYLIE